jgi:hypothetical protein
MKIASSLGEGDICALQATHILLKRAEPRQNGTGAIPS